MNITEWKLSRISTTKIIAAGFLLVILIGSGLLMLPFASRSGHTPYLSALFTATSASCVTGLVVVDTWQNWTVFGQLVILVMIQIGGLGFMTFGALFSMLLHKNIGLKQRDILYESVNGMQIGGVVRLVRKILLGTVLFESLGALILSIRFSFEMPVHRAVYYGIFHAISAFCNAGFDLMGYQGAFASLTGYAADPVVNIVIMLLIVIGGIGFIVWDDIYRCGLRVKEYMLHTKIVLTMTGILIFGGALLFYLLEKDSLCSKMGTGEIILTSLFNAVTPRTAGFNTVDTAGLSHGSIMLTILLMFIGGSPGSTAGGVKTTSIFALLLSVWANLRSTRGCEIYGRRLQEDVVQKAGIVCTLNLFLAVISAVAVMALHPQLAMRDILFEVFSAIGTVGMTTGITRSLGTASRWILMLLMYCGRIGSLTFILSFTERKKVPPLQKPTEKILIG